LAAAAGPADARIVKSCGRRTPLGAAPPRLRSIVAPGILGVRAGRATATTTMEYQRFDTPAIAPSERFEYWRTWYSQAVDGPMRLEPVGTLPRNFQASAEVLGDGEVDVVELHCGPALGSWLREATEAADRLRLIILAPTPGAIGHWYGHDVSLEKGAVALLGNTDGSWRAPTGLHVIQVNVPRAAVAITDAEIARIDDRQLVQRDPVFASLVRPVLLGMAGRLRELSHADMTELPAVWPSMIAMLVRSLAGRDANGAEPALARRIQVRRFIRAHLADPRLSPDAIARALHVSRRTLYASFPATDGIAAEIRRQRLRRAQAMLLDPAVKRPIAEIGAAVGLPSPAHFSRLFRAEYGHSPRQARAHRQQDAQRPQDTTKLAIG
jgi:AraC-like DNA-binding protein